MDCRDVRRLADAFVSDQVLVETAQAIVAHLDGCAPCRAEVDGLRRLRSAVRSAVHHAPDLQVRPEFAATLAARLRETARQAAAEAPAGETRGPTAGPRRLPWARLAVAATVMLAVGGAVMTQQWAARAWTALVVAAAGDHRYCALDHQLDEAPIPLADAAERFGGLHRAIESVTLPATDAAGVPLEILDRHSCVFQGRRFVHLVFAYRDEVVSVLLTDDPRPPLPWVRGAAGAVGDAGAADGYSLASFTGGRHAAFVVAALGPGEVRTLAQAVAGPLTRAMAGV